MLSVQNISEVAVTMKFDQGHRNSYVNITFKEGKAGKISSKKEDQKYKFSLNRN